MNNEETTIRELYRKWAGKEAVGLSLMPVSGSYRRYFRIEGETGSVIGVWNEDTKENDAFLSFTRTFHSLELPVPDLLAADPGGKAYLLSDLGDQTLFGFLSAVRRDDRDFPEAAEKIYRKVIGFLPLFQVTGGKGVDYSRCYPRKVFDSQSMHWDLNYFKYYFLKLARIPYDEQKLEDDFMTLTGFLLEAEAGHFMYRDFQSRNIMLLNDEPHFIDYQGGRKGPLQYDIASLLYDAKASIPEASREKLVDCYLDELEKLLSVDRKSFRQYYYGFVLIRILQALGAYGFRGYYENKPHFLRSIPFAVVNLETLIPKLPQTLKMPMLNEVLEQIIRTPAFRHSRVPENELTVRLYSFSYRNGIPADDTGNGGGFVFDCRALPNPGKQEEFRRFTGKDRLVIDFFAKEPSVDAFLNHASSLVDQSINRYVERGFTSLTVGFGCTGGQHRSVFCTEELAKHIRSRFNVNVIVCHIELEKNSPHNAGWLT